MSDRCAQCLAAHERSLAELVARIAELEAQLQHLESWGYPDENNPWADLAEYFGLDEETVDGAEDVVRYAMDWDRQARERIERLEDVLEAAKEYRDAEQVQMLNDFKYDEPKYERQQRAKAALDAAIAVYREGEKC